MLTPALFQVRGFESWCYDHTPIGLRTICGTTTTPGERAGHLRRVKNESVLHFISSNGGTFDISSISEVFSNSRFLVFYYQRKAQTPTDPEPPTFTRKLEHCCFKNVPQNRDSRHVSMKSITTVKKHVANLSSLQYL